MLKEPPLQGAGQQKVEAGSGEVNGVAQHMSLGVLAVILKNAHFTYECVTINIKRMLAPLKMILLTTSWRNGLLAIVSELKGFIAWDALLKSKMWLWKGRQWTHMQSSVSRSSGWAIAYAHYLVNYTLISSVTLATFICLCSCQAHPAHSWSAK